jgi:hypothetical protein
MDFAEQNSIRKLIDDLNGAPEQAVPEQFASVEAMLNATTERAQDMIIGRGTDEVLTPTWTMVTVKGQLVVFATPFDGGDGYKDIIAEAMKKFMTEAKVVRYSFISEAWAASPLKEEWDKGDRRPPSEREDRIEVVLITVADKSGSWVRTLEMVRDWETGKVIELKQQKEFKDEAHEGRFANLLADEA